MQVIKCRICGEDTTHSVNSSMYGQVHRYGPRDHEFDPIPAPDSFERIIDELGPSNMADRLRILVERDRKGWEWMVAKWNAAEMALQREKQARHA